MKASVFLLMLSLPIGVNAQSRSASCEIRPLWTIKGGPRSATLGALGGFQTDGREGITVRSFKFQDTGLVVTAGLDNEFDYSSSKPRPWQISLAITVSDQEKKDIFESVDSSEASTLYRKGWNLQVSKNIFLDNRIYMFSLNCWDGTGRSPHGRH